MALDRLVVATTNPGKQVVFARAFHDRFEVCGLDAFAPLITPEEDAETFEDNARIKALYYRNELSTVVGQQAWILADDSGIEVDFLGGAPGVRSARFAGENASDAENVDKLLHLLRDVPIAERTARFVCDLVLLRVDGSRDLHAHGICEGRISFECKGAGGFGYDPVFIPDGLTQTFAEVPERKRELSHRGAAIDLLQRQLVPIG